MKIKELSVRWRKTKQLTCDSMFMNVETMTVSNKWISTIIVQKIRAIKSRLYQLELGEKCSDQQLGS